MTTRVPLRVTVWIRVSLFGGVFDAKVDSAMFSFQVPADVSSAGCAACNTVTTRDSADASMRVFRASIDHLPGSFFYGHWASARGAEYTPRRMCLVSSACSPRYTLKCAECGASLMMADRYKYARNGRPEVIVGSRCVSSALNALESLALCIASLARGSARTPLYLFGGVTRIAAFPSPLRCA